MYFLFVDRPELEAIHILLSDEHYSDVTTTERNQMMMCVVLSPPVPLDIDLERPCLPSAKGRYLYVVLVRESSDTGMLQISELRVYSGELYHDCEN